MRLALAPKVAVVEEVTAVAEEDEVVGIGKQGGTVTAMRTLLNAASMKQKKRTILEIIE